MTHLHVTLSAHLDLRIEVVVPVSHPRVSSTYGSELDQGNETGSRKNRRNRPQLTVAAPVLSRKHAVAFCLLLRAHAAALRRRGARSSPSPLSGWYLSRKGVQVLVESEGESEGGHVVRVGGQHKRQPPRAATAKFSPAVTGVRPRGGYQAPEWEQERPPEAQERQTDARFASSPALYFWRIRSTRKSLSS